MMPARYPFQMIAILAVFALAVNFVPISAISGINDLAESDACCSQDDESSVPTCKGVDSAPLEEDCCPDSCKNCFLSCCAGPVSLAHSFAIQGPLVVSADTVAPYCTNFSSGYPGEIYHPPYL